MTAFHNPGATGPRLPTLVDDTTYGAWETALFSLLRAQKATRILSKNWRTITEAEQRALEATGDWASEEAFAYMYIERSTEKVHNQLENAGWAFGQLEMQAGYALAYYHLIKATIAKVRKDSIISVIHDFVHSRLEEHGDPAKLWDRLVKVSKRLKDLNPSIDGLIIYHFLDEIKESQWFPTLHTLVEEGSANTVSTFAPHIQKLATRPTVATPRLEKPSKDQDGRKTREESIAEARRQQAGKPGYNSEGNHKKCGKPHRGGDDKCFLIHLELRDARRQQQLALPAPPSALSNASTFSSGLMAYAGAVQKAMVLYNSGCNKTTFNDPRWFVEMGPIDSAPVVTAAGVVAGCQYGGIVEYQIVAPDGVVNTFRHRARYSPDQPVNLVSSSELYKGSGLEHSHQRSCLVLGNRAIVSLNSTHGVPIFEGVIVPDRSTDFEFLMTTFSTPRIDYEFMHRRLLHAGGDVVVEACKNAGITLKDVSPYHCDACALGKAHDVKPLKADRPASHVHEKLHFDYIEHKKAEPAYMGITGFVHSVDQYSGFHRIRFTKTKGEAFEATKAMIIEAGNRG